MHKNGAFCTNSVGLVLTKLGSDLKIQNLTVEALKLIGFGCITQIGTEFSANFIADLILVY
jgi:hypothetical protein